MSYYDVLAETKEYFYFKRREAIAACPHFHSAVEMLFCESGEVKVVVDGEARILKAGDGCFSDSFCVHAYEKNPQANVCVILGDKGYFERFFAKHGDKAPPKFFAFDNFTLLAYLHGVCEKKYANERDMYAVFDGAMQILLAAISQSVGLVPRERNKQSTLVGKVLQYAETHISDDLSLLRVARVFGFSHEHLSRILHKHLFENWNVYVGRLRVRRAHALLNENPELSVLSVAFDCGFESPNTFYRAYKKEYGVSPRRGKTENKAKNINY